MSFNDYQQVKINRLLTTEFKKQYELIPVEFKNNYYFEEFMLEMAEIYAKVNTKDKNKIEYPNWETSFQISDDTENNLSTIIKSTIIEEDVVDKSEMQVKLEKDGTLYFSWIFAFVRKKQYLPERDDTIYELKMKSSDDKSKIFVEYTITVTDEIPYRCHMSSIFDNGIEEISRVTEAVSTQTNEVIFHEEFVSIGDVDLKEIQEWQNRIEHNSIKPLNIRDDNSTLSEIQYHSNIKEVFACKCKIDETTRYAVCWKPDCFENEAYQATFESISQFGSPKLNLSHKLDLNEIPWLIEISEDDYNVLMGKISKSNDQQLKKVLKQ